MGACQSQDDAPSATANPTAPGAPSPTEPAAAEAAPEAPTPRVTGVAHVDALCDAAALRLSEAIPVENPDLDADALAAQLSSATPETMLAALEAAGEGGAAAGATVPALEQLISDPQLAISHSAFSALARVSPSDARRVCMQIAGDHDAEHSRRIMAASTLGSLGRPGLDGLLAIRADAATYIDHQVVQAGFLTAARFPIAVRDTLFSAVGYCNERPELPACATLRRAQTLVNPAYDRPSDAVLALEWAERFVLVSGNIDAQWNDAFSAVLTSSPALAAASLERLQGRGPTDALIPASLRVLSNPGVERRDRIGQARWLLGLGATLEQHRDAIAATLQENDGELVSMVAVAAGVELTSAQSSALARFGGQSRTSIGFVARLAATQAIGAYETGADSPDQERARTTVARRDMTQLAATLTDITLPVHSALDAACIGAAGQREAFAQALLDPSIPASARALEVAVHGAAPTPELATKLIEYIDSSSMTPQIAAWLVAADQSEAVEQAAERNLNDARAARRWRAVQWANITELTLSQDALIAALVAPNAAQEVTLPISRDVILAKLIATPPLPLDRAISLAESNSHGAASTHTALLLAAAYQTRCTTP